MRTAREDREFERDLSRPELYLLCSGAVGDKLSFILTEAYNFPAPTSRETANATLVDVESGRSPFGWRRSNGQLVGARAAFESAARSLLERDGKATTPEELWLAGRFGLERPSADPTGPRSFEQLVDDFDRLAGLEREADAVSSKNWDELRQVLNSIDEGSPDPHGALRAQVREVDATIDDLRSAAGRLLDLARERPAGPELGEVNETLISMVPEGQRAGLLLTDPSQCTPARVDELISRLHGQIRELSKKRDTLDDRYRQLTETEKRAWDKQRDPAAQPR